MVNPRATNDDLTAKARIRNAALDLYAQYGEERVSLRAVAAEAGVTLGLVQHHFKTKARLREAVDQLVVDHFAQAIADSSAHGASIGMAAARDEAVREMLAANPTVVNYVRRAVLEPSDSQMHLLQVLIDLTHREVTGMRDSGLASSQRPESEQILSILVRQMGALLLQPLIDATWDRVASPREHKPRVSIRVEQDSASVPPAR